MQSLRRLFIIITIISCCLQAQGADKYTDENRPYEFGFSIDGEQHRHEKKDENGIIMGEFGFITADGVYHVTVYATDENGNFKILSMKNIRVKPYPSGPERKGHSLPLPPSQNTPQTQGATPQTQGATPPPQKPISIQPPAKSCSHCSIPTTSTQAPQLTDLSVPQNQNPPYGGNGLQYNQPGAPPNLPNQGIGPNYLQPGLGGPDNQQNYPNQGAEPQQHGSGYNQQGSPDQQGGPTYNQQSGPVSNQQGSPPYNQQGGPVSNQQGSPPYNQQGGPAYNQQDGPVSNQQGNPPYNQQGGPVSNQQSGPGYNQQGDPAYNQQGGPAYNQQSGLDGAQYPEQAPPSSGDRNPKQFNPPQGFAGSDAGQQYGGAGGFEAPQGSPNKPTLISAQMQIVDKNTDIHQRGPGEREGLPDGLTKDDMTQLLYTFNYTVGFHGHHEEGYVNGAKVGYYYITGRNGVRTRVDYVADEKGFRPKITQEVLDLLSDDVPKPETEKDEKYGLKGYEFKWLYYPENPKRR